MVASLVSSIDEEMIFYASGTTIECNSGDDGLFDVILLTTASLLRRSDAEDMVAENIKIIVHFWDGKSYEGEVFGCDFYYNIATVWIRSEVALQIAVLRYIDDSISICPTARDLREAIKPILRRHSNKFCLAPGDKVVAVGRHHMKRNELMVTPGIFSADCCRLDCKELFRVNCKITKVERGSPSYIVGINPNDVIVQCDGKKVKSFLGVGQAVELDVIRPHDGVYLSVSIFVNEATRVNRWPIPRAHRIRKRRLQG